MAYAIYLTHPQVNIDRDTSVPNWSLSELGLQRAIAASELPWVKSIDRIVSSDETKAQETAACFARSLSIDCQIGHNMGENDRSSTGFLPPDLFEVAANHFMNSPEVSYRGWERAVDAQARIVASVELAVRAHTGDGAILLVGHGGVGTLLKCHIADRKIARVEDQPGNGGGNIFAFDLETKSLLCDWTPMEEFTGVSS
ncbi:MAG: histidine phosphatase family protein [Pseudomonadota bacterium]